MPTHDPLRQVQQLRQVLAGDKMPTAFLLGAGCPCAIRVDDGKGNQKPLIPDVARLTEAVRSKLSADEQTKSSIAAILKQLQERLGAEPNIEQILTQVRTLRQVVGKGQMDGLSATDLDGLDVAACEHIVQLVAEELPNEQTPFHDLARWVIAISRAHPVEIFTTNYDLLIEQSLESCRAPYFDGFVGVRRAFFDVNAIEQDGLPIRWARLWKLHGSISWFQVEGEQVFRAHHQSKGARRLIHPSHLKYDESRRMPYLAMIDRLRVFLKQEPAAMFICGYSFSDEHLNEVLVQGLEGNPSAGCFALLFSPLEKYKAACKIAKSRPNLNLLAADGGIIGTHQGKWVTPGSVDPSLLGSAFAIQTAPAAATGTAKPDKESGKPGDADGPPQDTKCLLGDFSGLGKFLSEIAGSQTISRTSNGT